jgi:hypothetical protein
MSRASNYQNQKEKKVGKWLLEKCAKRKTLQKGLVFYPLYIMLLSSLNPVHSVLALFWSSTKRKCIGRRNERSGIIVLESRTLQGEKERHQFGLYARRRAGFFSAFFAREGLGFDCN